MPEGWEEDRREPIPIPLKALIPAIPREDGELQELAEDLWFMGMRFMGLRESKFERGNQWLGTKRRDPNSWTLEVWNRVLGFLKGIAEGWAGRRDGLFTGSSNSDSNGWLQS